MFIGNILAESDEVGTILGEFPLEFRDAGRILAIGGEIYETRSWLQDQLMITGSETSVDPYEEST